MNVFGYILKIYSLLDKKVKEDDQLKPQLLYFVNKISNERNPQTRMQHSLHIKFHFLIFYHFLLFFNNILCYIINNIMSYNLILKQIYLMVKRNYLEINTIRRQTKINLKGP